MNLGNWKEIHNAKCKISYNIYSNDNVVLLGILLTTNFAIKLHLMAFIKQVACFTNNQKISDGRTSQETP